MSFRTCCRKLSFVFALLAMAVLAAPAFAQNCLLDQYRKVNSQPLNCTANDVRVARAINTRNLDGSARTDCFPGETFNFIADFLVQTSSNKTRSNIGLYFAVGDPTVQTQALTGSCSDNVIAPAAHNCSANTTVQCGSTNYDELDTSQFPNDNCGDTSSTDPTVCLNSSNQVVACPAPAGGSTWPGTQIITVEIDGFTCPNTTGQNVQLPNCTSWQVPGKAIQCITAAPYYPYPFDANNKPEAIPGSPSKCNCDTVTLPITVQSPSVTVAKSCTTTDSPGTNTSCNLFPEGGSVTYTVDVTNTSNFGSIVVDQVCDNRYGKIFTASGFTPACAVGSECTASLCTASGTPFTWCTGAGTGTPQAGDTCATGTTCTSSAPGTIAQGATGSCTFTASQAEEKVVTDTVSVKGHGGTGGGAFGPSNSNPVTVTSHEATTTGTITKSYVTTTDACATVRYGVEVQNTSASGTDETLTLTGLFDDSVDITTTGTHVLGTTCAATGQGTLSGAGGAGALPKTLAVNGGTYTCQFDTQFCGAVGTIVSTPGTCTGGFCSAGQPNTQTCSLNSDCDVTCNGIHHTDTVTATLTGDEGASDVVSLTPGTLTVSECLTASSH